MFIKALASGPKPATRNARVSLVLLCCQAIRNLIPQKCGGGGNRWFVRMEVHYILQSYYITIIYISFLPARQWGNDSLIRMTRIRRFCSNGFHRVDIHTELCWDTQQLQGTSQLLRLKSQNCWQTTAKWPTNRRFPTDVPMDFLVSPLPLTEVFWCDGCVGSCYRGWDLSI